jgi:secreted trypsin-like serine protease
MKRVVWWFSVASMVCSVPTVGMWHRLRGKPTRRLASVAVALAVLACVAAVPAWGSARDGSRTPQIVGGMTAGAGTWPWMAYVINSLPGGTMQELCSGTVIAPNVVLTAAHCVADTTTGITYPAAEFTVITGSADWSDTTARQVSGVSRVVVYPNVEWYTNPNGGTHADGDIALLQLSTPTSAPAMPLASDPADSALYDAGTGAAVAGWGLTDPADTVTPTVLQWGDTVVQSTAWCVQQAADVGAVFDSFDQTCTINAPSDDVSTCNGDSGGPLVVVAPDGSSLIELAVTSWDENCSTQNADFFTRVDVLAWWINEWVAALAPPAITTQAASSVTATSAQLNGQLNPNSSATTYQFQYGTSTAYGQSTFESTTNGDTIMPVDASLTGLAAATTYHFRLVGANANGTSDGADQTFTTAGPLTGRYRGQTTQRWPIVLRVAAGGRAMSALTFSFEMKCTRRPLPSYSVTPLSTSNPTWKLNDAAGLGFSDTSYDTDGTRYRVSGTFTTTGAASGMLTATRKTRRNGSCSTGTVHWHAIRS